MQVVRFVGISWVAVVLACSSNVTGTTSTGGGGPMPPSSSGSAGITIQDFTFSPSTITVKAGTTVSWTNNGPSAHTTTSDMGAWNSPTLSAPGGGGGYGGGGGSAGGSFSFTFNQAGTYGYHCSIHPPTLAQYRGFVGTVVVNP